MQQQPWMHSQYTYYNNGHSLSLGMSYVQEDGKLDTPLEDQLDLPGSCLNMQHLGIGL